MTTPGDFADGAFMLMPFMNKICIACNKRPAKIKFVKIIDGKWQDCMICQTCAVKFARQEGEGIDLKLDYILEGLMERDKSSEGGSEPGAKLAAKASNLAANDVKCSRCGLSYLSYRNTLILGCSGCYESFRDQLREDLRRFHGAVKHEGRRPAFSSAPPEALSISSSPTMLGALLDSEAGALVEVTEEEKETSGVVELKQQLQDAIAAEDFTRAARLRDEINNLEREAAPDAASEGSEGSPSSDDRESADDCDSEAGR